MRRRRVSRIVAAAVCLAVFAACGETTSAPSRPAPRNPFEPTFEAEQAPTINVFSAVPATIEFGESATLEWEIDDPTALLTIDNGIGAAFGTSRLVSPFETTTYTLFASNGIGSTSQSVTVTVTGSEPVSDGATTTSPAASEWEPAAQSLVGLPSECGNMSFVSAHPYVDSVIAGIAQQGLWIDNAVDGSFARLGDGPSSATIANRTSGIVYDPDVPGQFWQSGIYNGAGVFRTSDGGVTFQQLGNVEHSDNVSIDFTDPFRLTILSGKHESSTLFRSQDGGVTWQDISATLPAEIGYATSPYVINANTYLLGTNNGPNAGVFYTDNGGLSWSSVFQGPISGRPIVGRADGALYWLLDFGGGLIRSGDLGVTWTVVNSSAPFARFPGSLVQLPSGYFAALGDARVVVSSDRGITWEGVGSALPYAATGLTYAPSRGEFYIWKQDCAAGANPISADSIMSTPYP